eukprot:TRINITY_DN6682_c0_g1_i1.p1 TRINITY_DN6682_c0_g1~~TRINITY_DN6682_c0_g1_i1.p1  ORF type:complete len:257 (+),score=70.10 TRINITY_DN6682_c0_g1_i1:31-771(+)
MKLFALVFLLLCGSLFVHCQDENEEETHYKYNDEYEVINEPSSFVTTHYILPRFHDKRFTSGDPVEILIGFYNRGETNTFNITSITASLRHPMNSKYYLQNFTKAEYNVQVGPLEQATLSYKFFPEMLEARDYIFVANVHYTDESEHTTEVFNEQIFLVEPETTFDLQTLFAYFAIISVLGIIAFFAKDYLVGSLLKKRGGGEKKSKQSFYETGTERKVAVNDNEWLKGTSAEAFAKKSGKGKKKN